MDFLLWVQGWRDPVLTMFFSAVTTLGSEDFLLVILALIYWCVNRTLGLRLAVVVLASEYVNEALKLLVAEPRPGPPIVPLDAETAPGSAWPSGHAQHAVALWGTLAVLVRRPWLSGVALALIGLIGFSRLYLGLHWPVDVVSGWLIGGAILAGALLLFARVPAVEARTLPLGWLGLGLILPLALLVLAPTDFNTRVVGAALGLLLGWWLERRTVGFEAPAPLLQQALKVGIGLAVAFGLRIGLKAAFGAIWPGAPGADVLRYLIVGLWVAWLAPLVFVRLFGRAPAISPVTGRQASAGEEVVDGTIDDGR